MRRMERQVKEIEDIESIISRSDVCRIAFADNNTPYIVTLNFGYSGGDNPCLYFHCAPEGRKIEMIKKNNRVCFEMDTDHEIYSGEKGCDWGMKFSSVIGYGNISIVEDRKLKIEGLDCLMAHYSDQKGLSYNEKVLGKTLVLKLDIHEMTGKRK
jgi:nitroimidazol reductase NimA-like FMN-containing flavoprotein (pyridoxamine 5'-phosphate oxidase superfamily)